MSDETSKEVVAQKTSFQAMTTDMVCTMDDVVSAFVAKYETNLFARKKELSKEIRAVDDRLAALNKTVLAKVTGEEFDGVAIEPFGLTSELDDTTLVWDKDDGDEVRFSITITAKESNTYYHNKVTVTRSKPVPSQYGDKHNELEADLKPLRVELSEVLDNIKSIARKERQVRGRIAIRKLQDAGYTDLMEDAELKQLVEL